MKQFAVIGLGNFGYYLATHLYSKGNDVLAIDKNPARVQEIKDHVSRAVVTDATDMKALESLGIKEMDAVAMCVGTVLSNSILIALNLNDIGVKRLLAMSISEAHGRILKKINRGAEVFFPEKIWHFLWQNVCITRICWIICPSVMII
ncbi:MAG: TrkA family potassium uptake protein, partial [Desulfobacteraceae bacterium]|nr:TrkA family potassium uptake protein [Desulfobacteraceae bacterium]